MVSRGYCCIERTGRQHRWPPELPDGVLLSSDLSRALETESVVRPAFDEGKRCMRGSGRLPTDPAGRAHRHPFPVGDPLLWNARRWQQPDIVAFRISVHVFPPITGVPTRTP